MLYRSLTAMFLLLTASSSLNTTSLSVTPWILPGMAYNPRNFDLDGASSVSTRDQINEDLRLLKTAGIKSLVTYSAAGILGSIPEIARKVGLDGVIIMGIWDIFSQEEWENALKQARFVDGYCIGNEGLGVRYTPDLLSARMVELRRLTGLPVTTSEPIDHYLDGPYRTWLREHSDWLFPLAHPFWAFETEPKQAVDWITSRYDSLSAASGRKVILKEAGFPTSGDRLLDENRQLTFFKTLESKSVSFFYFEAFDQPWKPKALNRSNVEAHWGLYRSDGSPKKAALWLMRRKEEK